MKTAQSPAVLRLATVSGLCLVGGVTILSRR